MSANDAFGNACCFTFYKKGIKKTRYCYRVVYWLIVVVFEWERI
jgi:hypothetical protein